MTFQSFKKTLEVATVVFIVPFLVFANEGGSIKNYLKAESIPALITVIVGAITQIGYFVVVFFIIYAGFLFVTARGSDAKLGKAKEVFLWTVVGAAILLGAQILSGVIQGTVNQLKSGHAIPSSEQYNV